MYQLQIIDIDTYENKYYYKLRITTSLSSCSRDVRVRLQDLNQLAKNLQAENYSHNFPPFPEKSLFSSWFQSTETKEELQENMKAIQTYLSGINRNIPLRTEAITMFVNSTFDPERTISLKFSGINKELFYKSFIKTAVIKKCSFNKIFRVTADKTKNVYVVHQFLIPQNDISKNELEIYKKNQQLITDFTHIVKCLQIGQILKKKSMFQRKIKKTLYNQLKIPSDAQYDVFYAVEEFVQTPMNEIITLRQTNSQYFDLELLTEALMTLTTVAQYYQFLQINQKQFSINNFFYDERKGFKIGGLSPIFSYKKKYRLKFENNPNDYKILNPPEQNGSAGNYVVNKFANSKTDTWQIGIILLCMSSLCFPSDLIQPEIIKQKLQIVQHQYGETLSGLIKDMLDISPYNRLSLNEVLNFGELIMPMKLQYLKFEQYVERIKINSMSQQLLEQLDQQLKEKTKRQYIIIIILDKPIVQQLFLLYLERLKKEQVIQLTLNIPNQEITVDTLERASKIINEYKYVERLNLNLKECKLIKEGIQQIIQKLYAIQTLKQITLDISNIKDILIPQQQQERKIKLVIYNN